MCGPRRGGGVKPWPPGAACDRRMWQVSSDYDSLPVRLQKRSATVCWSKDRIPGPRPRHRLGTHLYAYTNTVCEPSVFDSRLRRAVSDLMYRKPGRERNLGIAEPKKRWKRSLGFAKGWQLGTLLTLSSGLPFTPTIAGDALGLNSSIAYDFSGPSVPGRLPETS